MNYRKNTQIHKISRRISGAALFLLISIFCAMSVFAAPKVKVVSYEGRGKVEVEFHSKVKYRNLKITVRDTSGKSYAAKITDRDSDDLDFKISGFREGVTYKFTIRGIRERSEKNYGSISGKIYIPKASDLPKVKKIEYDKKDQEVSFEFDGLVQWKKAKVTISDGKKNYVRKIDEKDRDEIEVKVSSLKKGKKYSYTISGVRRKGGNKYVSVKGTFIA